MTSAPSWAEPDPPPADDAADEHLADLLEECLRAEQALAGGSAAIVQAAPEHLRPRLEQLLALGQALRARSGRRAAPSSLGAARARRRACAAPPSPG